MAIKLGSTDINSVNLGSINLNRIYSGLDVVFGGAFSPLDLNPFVWTAPRLAVTESSGKVSALPDISGNGNDLTQLVGGSQPIYNGSNLSFNAVPTVDLNGTSHFLRNSALSSGLGTSTIFLVYKVNSFVLSGDQVFGTENINDKRLFYGTGGFLEGVVRNGSGSQGLTGIIGGGIAIGDVGIIMMQFEGTALRVKVNNNPINENLSFGTNSVTNQISIGYSIGLNSRFLNMDFAELIIANSALSSDNITKTMDYLNEIYAVW